MINTVIMAAAGIAGYIVANRFVPQNLFGLGKLTDALFGLGAMGVGYMMGNPYVFAFGVGALVEGLMFVFGFIQGAE